MSLRALLIAGFTLTTSATKLLVSDYHAPPAVNGTVYTLDFSHRGASVLSASLSKTNSFSACSIDPTWLDLALGKRRLVCLDEGIEVLNGSIYTLQIERDGGLKTLHSATTIGGPVFTKFYNDNTVVALAHYLGNAISTFKVTPDGAYTPLQNFTYYNDIPGPKKPQQNAAHPHQAIVDPTGKFMLFPDLGVDKVRAFSISPKTGLLTSIAGIQSPAGYGPRHGVFWKSAHQVYLFVTHELTNRIISYKVDYPRSGSLSFTKVDEVSTYGSRAVPADSAAAEIAVSPDQKYLLASNRGGPIFTVPNPDPKNATAIGSDSIITFKPSPEGKLSFVQLAPSGGSFPRHFQLNAKGNLIAVANQNTFSVAVYKRDVKTGLIGANVAGVSGLGMGGLTNVQWLE